jgi:hypothetical protein
VKYSTIPAESAPDMRLAGRNAWLQCYAMRIELPNASWASAAPRAEEDAHTLTVAGQSPSEWAPLDLLPPADRPLCVRTEVTSDDPLVLTITY